MSLAFGESASSRRRMGGREVLGGRKSHSHSREPDTYPFPYAIMRLRCVLLKLL